MFFVFFLFRLKSSTVFTGSVVIGQSQTWLQWKSSDVREEMRGRDRDDYRTRRRKVDIRRKRKGSRERHGREEMWEKQTWSIAERRSYSLCDACDTRWLMGFEWLKLHNGAMKMIVKHACNRVWICNVKVVRGIIKLTIIKLKIWNLIWEVKNKNNCCLFEMCGPPLSEIQHTIKTWPFSFACWYLWHFLTGERYETVGGK